MNIATAEAIVNTLIKQVNRHRNDITEGLKTGALEMSDLYNGNIKIEINVNKKMHLCKINIVEHDV